MQQQGRVESARGKTQIYRQGNRTVEKYTNGITSRESQHMGHIAQYTQEETSSAQRFLNLAKVLDVTQSAALQMYAREASHANTQEEATLRVE